MSSVIMAVVNFLIGIVVLILGVAVIQTNPWGGTVDVLLAVANFAWAIVLTKDYYERKI